MNSPFESSSQGHMDVVDLLRQEGADCGLIDRTNQCVLDDVCTANASLEARKVGQKVFLCKQCDVECCVVCRDKCHSKHQTGEIGFGLLKCQCSNVSCEAQPIKN